jgi:hypothetical protein
VLETPQILLSISSAILCVACKASIQSLAGACASRDPRPSGLWLRQEHLISIRGGSGQGSIESDDGAEGQEWDCGGGGGEASAHADADADADAAYVEELDDICREATIPTVIRLRDWDPVLNRTTRIRHRAFSLETVHDLSMLHYLVVNAYPEAAMALWCESGLNGTASSGGAKGPARIDLPAMLNDTHCSMRERLKEAVLQGDVDEARREVDEEFSQDFFGGHPELLFRLSCHGFLELVRDGNREGALAYASDQLSPFVDANPGYTPMLDDTLSALAYDETGPSDTKAAVMLDPFRRQELWLDINAAICRHCGLDPVSADDKLDSMLAWVDEQIREAGQVVENLDPERCGRLLYGEKEVERSREIMRTIREAMGEETAEDVPEEGAGQRMRALEEGMGLIDIQ